MPTDPAVEEGGTDGSQSGMIPHAWLLLSDSALPLGSFAFSSALESYIAHHRSCPPPHPPPRPPSHPSHPSQPSHPSLPAATLEAPAAPATAAPATAAPATAAATAKDQATAFLALSLRATAHSLLPFVIAAHASPARAALLDDELDACTLCTVARRASTSQGRALITVWEKSLCTLASPPPPPPPPPRAPSSSTPPPPSSSLGGAHDGEDGGNAWVQAYARAVRRGEAGGGHLAVAWGLVCRAAGLLAVDHVCYVFLLNHCKAVLSAAVRLGLIGPYHAQVVLALASTRRAIEAAVAAGKAVGPVHNAAQTVPVLDLYQGRHELLYSRVFNS